MTVPDVFIYQIRYFITLNNYPGFNINFYLNSLRNSVIIISIRTIIHS